MSTLTISNAEKIIQTCNTYQFGYAGTNPGDTGIVDFINCDGITTQVTLTWDESDGRYYNITICAKEILSINSFVTDEGIIGSCNNTQEVGIYSEQAGTDSGTWRVDVLNGDPSVKYRIRGTASFSGTGLSISFTNLNLTMLNTIHTTRTGSLFSVGANGERNGFYTIDGNGINCTLELLDINNNVISTTTFNN